MIHEEQITDHKEEPGNISEKEQPGAMEELESDFDDFLKSKSIHTVAEQTSTELESKTDSPDIFNQDDITDADNFKLQIFLSLFFALLDGFHAFIYTFISKHKIKTEDIALDERDRAGLDIYFKTQRVMNMLNKLPVELIGIIHIEYMYFQKFQDFKKKQDALIEEREPEEAPEESTKQGLELPVQEKKRPVVKRPVKRKNKKATRKAAVKKEAKPEETKQDE